MGLSALDKPSSKLAIAAKVGVSKLAAIISAKEESRSSGRPHFPSHFPIFPTISQTTREYQAGHPPKRTGRQRKRHNLKN
jgi:hypothetical protein